MRTVAAVAIAFCALPFAVSAQWPEYPSKNVPKGPDGKPNLDAPAPRTADGHPDLSGVWENVHGNSGEITRNRQGNPNRQPAPPPPPPNPANGPPVATFGNIGAGIKGGLPLQPWAYDLLKKRMEEHSKDNPDAHCLPMGLMQFHDHPEPRKIIQTPDEVVILYEANSGLRQIFTDGRSLPRPSDVDPWWYGYSAGHWDGDTLVVETTGFRDDGWLDVNGSPLTSDGKIIERFTRTSYGKLNIDVTIDDPKAYTKPFTVRVAQKIMLNTNLIEFICGENEQSDAHLVGK